jgi:hypothetical protein
MLAGFPFASDAFFDFALWVVDAEMEPLTLVPMVT